FFYITCKLGLDDLPEPVILMPAFETTGSDLYQTKSEHVFMDKKLSFWKTVKRFFYKGIA
ncbi:MAG: hypothetical protein SCABRO_02559, partial [Candidatus Scalindua brodae]